MAPKETVVTSFGVFDVWKWPNEASVKLKKGETMARERTSSQGAPSAPPGLVPPLGDWSRNQRQQLRPRDNWASALGQSAMAQCASCIYFNNARCRRHAPKGQEGWSAVYPSDYCGDHKLPKEAMMA